MSRALEAREVVLRLDGITKRFGNLVANDAINLDLHRGEVVALLGENGAGKTTLMNILFGHYTADEGTVEVFGTALPAGATGVALKAGVGMVHQHFTLAGNLTVLDNILLGTASLWSLGAGRSTGEKRVRELAKEFGLAVDPAAKINALSVGERQRVEILKALYRDARILILDEPTAVLTPQETDALFETLRRAVDRGLSVIFISHKLHEVMTISNRVVVLRHGKVAGETPTSATSPHALAEMMVGAEVTRPEPSKPVAGATLMRLRDVSAHPSGHRTGVSGINLELRSGQIVGLAGVSGNGQGVLADIISGEARPSRGEITIGNEVVRGWSPRAALAAGIGRIPEDRHSTGSIADFSLTENAILETYRSDEISRAGWMRWNTARLFTQGLIEKYDVRCPGPEARIRLLSGGNMQKLILGRVLEGAPRIILANQPVRGLDIGAVTYVQEQLIAARDAGAAILLISEDLDEILGVADVIRVISEGRLSPEFSRGEITAPEIGRWMAGEGFDHAA